MGVGSDLRQDDASGLIVAQRLISLENIKRNFDIKVIISYTAPENFTGEIINYKPSHLIIIDSANSGVEPATVSLVNYDEVESSSFCTHALSLHVLIKYLKDYEELKNMKIIFLGIQPEGLEFNEKITDKVSESIDELSVILEKTIKGL